MTLQNNMMRPFKISNTTQNFGFQNNGVSVCLKTVGIILSCLFFQLILASENLSSINTTSKESSLSLKQMLLSPGDLTNLHADLEPNCESCHTHFDKSNQTPLCLDCHEGIALDLTKNKNFHGKLKQSETADCKTCHTDHKGRDFDITNFDQEVFNHNQTNFILDNSHKNVDCKQCHNNNMDADELIKSGLLQLPKDSGFRFKEFECASCHIDYHEDALGQECQSCHNTKSWQSSDFDHDQTDFSLTDKHSEVQCSSCHLNNQFEPIETTCKSCHKAEEPHLGIFGETCVDCHTTKHWENTDYNHQKETGYPLKGSHLGSELNNIQCIDCHSTELNPATECNACHKNDDIHQGTNGELCADCHNQEDWEKVSFKHDLETTKFELDGAHSETACIDCHRPGAQINNNDDSVRECTACHQSDDPHGKSKIKDCKTCHNTESWTESIRFNHDFSQFPLTGSHQILVCESCHLTAKFFDQSAQCSSCHKDADVHQGALGEKCDQCHDSSTWSHWQFNHADQTKFLLEGAHNNLKCELCHNNTLPEPLQPGTDCISCHRDDDVHRGALGRDCKQCHSTDDFSDLIF